MLWWLGLCLCASSAAISRCFVMFIRPSACIRAASTALISATFDMGNFYECLLGNTSFGWNQGKISSILHVPGPDKSLARPGRKQATATIRGVVERFWDWQRCARTENAAASPLYMAVRLIPAVDSVQVWTCYSCYAIVESVWSEVVFVRCVRKMDRQKFEQSCAIKVCVKLGESATVTYES